jgi:hypothetical protein
MINTGISMKVNPSPTSIAQFLSPAIRCSLASRTDPWESSRSPNLIAISAREAEIGARWLLQEWSSLVERYIIHFMESSYE